MYAGVCWYEYCGKRLSRADVLALIGSLLGGSLTEVPSFVIDFRRGALSLMTLEVGRLAALNKESWLLQVDDVWRNKAPPLDIDERKELTLNGKRYTSNMLGIIYTALHWIFDGRSGQGFTLNNIQDMIYKSFDVKVDRSTRLYAVKILSDHGRPLTPNVNTYARRRKHRLVPECIERFKASGFSKAEESCLVS